MVSAPVLPRLTPLQFAPPPPLAAAPERPLQPASATSSATAPSTWAVRQVERIIIGHLSCRPGGSDPGQTPRDRAHTEEPGEGTTPHDGARSATGARAAPTESPGEHRR